MSSADIVGITSQLKSLLQSQQGEFYGPSHIHCFIGFFWGTARHRRLPDNFRVLDIADLTVEGNRSEPRHGRHPADSRLSLLRSSRPASFSMLGRRHGHPSARSSGYRPCSPASHPAVIALYSVNLRIMGKATCRFCSRRSSPSGSSRPRQGHDDTRHRRHHRPDRRRARLPGSSARKSAQPCARRQRT